MRCLHRGRPWHGATISEQSTGKIASRMLKWLSATAIRKWTATHVSSSHRSCIFRFLWAPFWWLLRTSFGLTAFSPARPTDIPPTDIWPIARPPAMATTSTGLSGLALSPRCWVLRHARMPCSSGTAAQILDSRRIQQLDGSRQPPRDIIFSDSLMAKT